MISSKYADITFDLKQVIQHLPPLLTNYLDNEPFLFIFQRRMIGKPCSVNEQTQAIISLV